jgi:hypothetical protein
LGVAIMSWLAVVTICRLRWLEVEPCSADHSPAVFE